MKIIFLIFTALVALATAEIARIRRCDDVDRDACQVHEARITPCGTSKKNRCEIKHEDNVSLSFDFTPNFVATKLKSEVYWANGVTDEPFSETKDSNGCTLTSCPTELGKQQTLDYSLYIHKNIPVGIYTIKWKVWNEENKAQVCCFLTNLRISKKK